MGTAKQAVKLQSPRENPRSRGYPRCLKKRRAGHHIRALSPLPLQDQYVTRRPDFKSRPYWKDKKITTQTRSRTQPPLANKLDRTLSASCELLPVQLPIYVWPFPFSIPFFINVNTEPHHVQLSTHVHETGFTRFIFCPSSIHVAYIEILDCDGNPHVFYTSTFMLESRCVYATGLTELRLT